MDEATDKLLRLLDEYGGRLYALLVKLVLRKDVAEELLQDLFLRLSGSKGFQRSPRPEQYLFRAAINLAFDWRNRNGRRAAGSELIDEVAADTDTPIEQVIRREELERVLHAMGRLSSANRELLTLRYLHGMSYDELANRLDTTPHRVRARCSKAVARLRTMITPTDWAREV